jgi:2-(1,2-epoxy-1,2-dihydrophenyl)acetyl-CoA isomerase
MIGVERDGSVVRLLLDRPQRGNALSLALLAALERGLNELGDDVRGVILTGRGSTFSTGADLSDLAGTVADVAYDDAVAAVSAALRQAPFPVVAAVEGRCLGAAVDVALSCDLLVAASDATFGIPATRLGILYAPTALARLRRRCGSSAVRRLVLFGEQISGDEAHTIGLVDVVSPPGDAVSRANAAALGAAAAVPGAVTATKHLLAALDDGSGDAADLDETRRALLGSPQRRAAIDEYRRR